MIGKERYITLKVSCKFKTEIKLMASFDRLNTDDRVIDEVGFTVLDPRLLQVDPSGTVIGEGVLCDWNLEKILGLSFMWFVAPELITHLFEEAIRYVLFDSQRG